MRTTVMQSNLTIGELSPDMLARVDHDMYYAGVAKAQNVVIMPHGGLRRRPGLTAAKDSKLLGDGKLFAFEFSTIQDYIIHLTPEKASVYKDGEYMTTVDIPGFFITVEECKEVDVAQSGDLMILTHRKYHPQVLIRQGAHDVWKVEPFPFEHIPQYIFPGETVEKDVRSDVIDETDEEDVWSDVRGYPAVCTFFQNRLWFAGSTQKPNSVWGSKINGFYDFDTGAGQMDYALFDTLDTEQYNQITNIYPGRNLMVFTTGSEFYNKADYITSETSAWKRSTGYGSRRIRPVMVDGAVLFVDRIGRTVRSALFEFQEDSFIAPSISVPSEHLIKNVVSIDAVKGTNIDVSDFVYIINRDGTMAVLNTLRAQKTEGWTEWVTEGKFIDVTVVNSIVYFVCERQGEFHLEYMNEGTTTDHNTFKQVEKPAVYDVVYNGNPVMHQGVKVVFTDHAGSTPVTEVTTTHTPALAQLTYKMILDNSMMDDTLGSTTTITLPRPAFDVEIGLDVELKVVTMPLNVQDQDGTARNDRKRVVRAMLNMRNSLGVYANLNYAPDRKFTVVLDQAPKPYTGLKEIFLLGYSRETQLEIYQKDPLPFKLLSLGWELEIGDN